MLANSAKIRNVRSAHDPFEGYRIIKVAPVTPVQSSILKACTQSGHSANLAFLDSLSVNFSGPLDISWMQRALIQLQARHESLRSDFSSDEKTICIYEDVQLNFFYDDISSLPDADQDLYISEYKLLETCHVFNPFRAPMFKSSVIRLSQASYEFVFTIHQLICDRWSLSSLVAELGVIYSAIARSEAANLPPAGCFSDYAFHLYRFAHSKAINLVNSYWIGQFGEGVPEMLLPTDAPRPVERSYKSVAFHHRLQTATLHNLQMAIDTPGCSFVISVIASFEILMSRLLKQERLVIGFPIQGDIPITSDVVGQCECMLPLASVVAARLSYDAYLARRQAQLLEAIEYPHASMDSLLNHFGLGADDALVPMLPVVLNMNCAVWESTKFHGLQHELSRIDGSFKNAELSMNIDRSGQIHCQYNPALFKSSTVLKIIREWEFIINWVSTHPTVKIGEIPAYDSLLDSNGSSNLDTGAGESPSSLNINASVSATIKEGETADDHASGLGFRMLNANGQLPANFTSPGEEHAYETPGTPLQKLVSDIWIESFDNTHIGIKDNFFELGGNSLMAAQLMNRLQKETGILLPLAMLFKHPTIESICALLESDRNGHPCNFVVPIKPYGKKHPLYLVHGAGSHALTFRSLAMSLDPEQPVYGLQAEGMNGIDLKLGSIEEMAARYVEAIISSNPAGPYSIAGYSIGGIIAFEMARQLQEQGKKVEFLGIFDTELRPQPRQESRTGYMLATIERAVKLSFFNLRKGIRNPRYACGRSVELLRAGLQVLSKRLRLSRAQRMQLLSAIQKMNMHNKAAIHKYQMIAQDIEIHLFRAEDRKDFINDVQTYGWKRFAMRGIKTHNIPGDHYHIFQAPHDREFARLLQSILDTGSPRPETE